MDAGKRKRARTVVQRADAIGVLETDFSAPRAAVWDLVTKPGNRLRWQGSDSVVENTANGRRGAGTQNHCTHGKDAIIEDILAWRPFDHITLTTLLPVPGAPKILMSYVFDELADGGAHFEVRFAKPKPKDLPFFEHIWPESVVQRCMAEGLVGADGFAVDASLIAADANEQRSVPSKDWKPEEIKDNAVRAAREYLATLDDAAFGAASPVTPKFVSRSDPAAQWTGAHKGHAFFAYAANYLIDTDHGVIVDVEATRAIRQAEVGAARTMLEWTETRFGIKPVSLTADSAYGSADSLAWLVKERRTLPRTSRSSTSPTEPTARSPAPTSPSTPNATVTRARRAKSWSNSDAPTPFPEAASQPRAQDSIAPANWIATSASSRRGAAPTQSLARSHGICTKTPATWLVRTPQRRNTWRPVAVGRKSRCYSRTSSESFVWPVSSDARRRVVRPRLG
jgi:hypothetical protein